MRNRVRIAASAGKATRAGGKPSLPGSASVVTADPMRDKGTRRRAYDNGGQRSSKNATTLSYLARSSCKDAR